MTYDPNQYYYHRPKYEYLSRWPCQCRVAAVCRRCHGKGYREEWLPLDEIFNHRPVTIMGYRLAGMPETSKLFSMPG